MSFGADVDLIAALPLLIAAGGLLYIAVLGFGASALRIRGRRRRRERGEQPQRPGKTPWNDWLAEINAREGRDAVDDGADGGKWRE